MSSPSIFLTLLNIPEGQSLHAQTAVAAAATERLQQRFGGNVKVIVYNPDPLRLMVLRPANKRERREIERSIRETQIVHAKGCFCPECVEKKKGRNR